MKIVKWIIAIVLSVVVAQIVHTAGAMMSMKYYMDPKLALFWSKIMMPSAGPPPASFFYWSLGLGIVSWLLIVIVYSVLRSAVPGKGAALKGLCFGFLIWLVSGLSGSFAMFLTINLPKYLIASWTIEELIILLINGMIIAALV